MKTAPLLALCLSLCTLNLPAQDKAGAAANPLNTTFDQFNRTPLMAAAQMSQADKVKELLSQGADPNAANGFGRTPLIVAAWDSSGESTRLLLEAGADPLAADQTGGTPLQYAVEQGNHAAAKLLIAAGAKPATAPDYAADRRKNLLLLAAAGGNAELVDLLQDNGAAADEQALVMCAAQGGLHGLVKRMLEKDPRLAHAQDRFHKTALMCAAESGDPECVRLLLQAGAAPDSEPYANKTPLGFAAQGGHVEAVRLLLEAGAADRPPFARAVSAMQEAVRAGHSRVVEVFLAAGAGINGCQPGYDSGSGAVSSPYVMPDTTYLGIDSLTPVNDGYNDSAVMNATVFHCGGTGMLQFVIDKGADVELCNGDGTTPLMAAAMRGYLPQARVLLAAGAKVDARDNRGNTALIHAVKSRNAGLVRALLAAGADANAANAQGMTPLLYAVLANAPECLAALQEAGADTAAKNKAGHGVAQLAAFGGARGVLEKALADGLDANTCDAAGHNLLAYAVLGGQAGLVPFLLEKGADLHAKDAEGMTPLMYAVLQKEASHPSVFRPSDKPAPDLAALLLEHGADAKAADNDGATALHYAVLAQNTPEQIGKLIAAGADLAAKDKDGHDAFSLAVLLGQTPVIEKLLELGADPNARDRKGVPLLQLVLDKPFTARPDRLFALGRLIAQRQAQPALLHGETLFRGGMAPADPISLPVNSHGVGLMLLLRGADPMMRDKNGELLVLRFLAARGHHAEQAAACLLYALKVKPDTVSENEQARLLIDVIRHIDMFRPSECAHETPRPNPVEKLLQLGISPDVADVDGNTPLGAAAFYGNLAAAKTLLEHGADVNKADAGGMTPIHFAVLCKRSGDNEAMVAFLLRQPGIDVNARSKDGTPLTDAAAGANLRVVKLLLDAGADVTATDLYGRNPLMAACSNPVAQVFQTLYDLGKIDPKAKDGGGVDDTLSYAVLHGRQAAIDMLLPHGVTATEAQGVYGERLLQSALRSHCPSVARGLLEHGVNPKLVLPQDKNRTLLHLAAKSCPELVPDLLAAGADPKAVTTDGQTALIYAVSRSDTYAPQRLAAIRALVAAGCDPAAKDNNGCSALNQAERAGNKEQAELLRSLSAPGQ